MNYGDQYWTTATRRRLRRAAPAAGQAHEIRAGRDQPEADAGAEASLASEDRQMTAATEATQDTAHRRRHRDDGKDTSTEAQARAVNAVEERDDAAAGSERTPAPVEKTAAAAPMAVDDDDDDGEGNVDTRTDGRMEATEAEEEMDVNMTESTDIADAGNGGETEHDDDDPAAERPQRYRHYYYDTTRDDDNIDDNGPPAGDDVGNHETPAAETIPPAATPSWYRMTRTTLTLTGAPPPEWSATRLTQRLRGLPTTMTTVVLDGAINSATNAHKRRAVALAISSALRTRRITWSVTLRDLHLTNEIAETLAEALLPSMEKVQHLEITNISGQSKALGRLIQGLTANQSKSTGLRGLAVTRDVGRGTSVAGITKLCRASVHLPHLDVSGNELRAVDVAQLATAAIGHTHLIDITITGNRAFHKNGRTPPRSSEPAVYSAQAHPMGRRYDRWGADQAGRRGNKHSSGTGVASTQGLQNWHAATARPPTATPMV